MTPEVFAERWRRFRRYAGGLAAESVARARAAAIIAHCRRIIRGLGQARDTRRAGATSYNNSKITGPPRTWRPPRSCHDDTIDGLVEKPLTLDIDDLLKKVSLEEDLSPRCVEACSRWWCRGPVFSWRSCEASRRRRRKPANIS